MHAQHATRSRSCATRAEHVTGVPDRASPTSTTRPPGCSRPTSSSSPAARAWARRRSRSTSPRTPRCCTAARSACSASKCRRDQLVQRLLCSQARVDLSTLRRGYLHRPRLARLTIAAGQLYEAPIYIDDTAGADRARRSRTRARRLKAEHGLGLLVIDYLQLMRGSRQGREPRSRKISQITRSLKALAKELDIPVVALSQLSRAPESARAAQQDPAALGPARVGRDRAGRRHRALHLPRGDVQARRRGAEEQGARSSSPSSATARPASST